MKRMVSRAGAMVLVVGVIVSGCASSPESQAQGWKRVGTTLLNVVLSPVMLAAGIAQGLGFLPFTVDADVKELNKALVQAHAVSLDDSYKATFNVSITDTQVDPKSGDVLGQRPIYGVYNPQGIFEAQRAFLRVLTSQGMTEEKAQHYVVVGNYKYAWSRGVILLAVVYRHPGTAPIRVRAKETGIVTTLRPGYHQGWHEAHLQDVDGQAIDEVIDWSAMEYKILRQDKVVATLLVLAAEGVKSGKRSHDYWAAERRWSAGDTNAIMQESFDRVKQRLPS